MADKLDVAFGPDPILASLEQQFTDGIISAGTYQQARSQRTSELMKTNNLPAMGIGGQGFYTPSLNVYNENDKQNAEFFKRQEELKKNLSGKSVLQPTGEGGVYSASTFDSKGNLVDVNVGKTNDPAAKGKSNYDPNATGSQRFFYDSQGNKLTAAQAASTGSGKEFAAAGWDIGFGPGMIGPGIKADTSEREARIAARESKITNTIPQTQPAPNPTPSTPSVTPVAIAAPVVPVKTAPIDTILYPSDDLLPIEIMADLIFENIGGQELINIARNDTVNGQSVVYQPIKNLTQIQQQYNPNNIVGLQETSDKYFQNFAIKLETKVSEDGNGPDGAHVYIDPNTGDLVIEVINVETGEQVELEITTSGTIYEAEL